MGGGDLLKKTSGWRWFKNKREDLFMGGAKEMRVSGSNLFYVFQRNRSWYYKCSGP